MRPREKPGRLSRSDRHEIRERIRAGQTHAETASAIAMLYEVGAAAAGTYGRLPATSASAFSGSTDGWGARGDFTRAEGRRVAQSDREATEPGALNDLAGGACQRSCGPISSLASRARGDENGAAPEAGEAGMQSTAACEGGAVAGPKLVPGADCPSPQARAS